MFMPNSPVTPTNGNVASSPTQNITPLTQATPATSLNPFGANSSASTPPLERTATNLSEQSATQPHRGNDSQATQPVSPRLVRQDATSNLFLHH